MAAFIAAPWGLTGAQPAAAAQQLSPLAPPSAPAVRCGGNSVVRGRVGRVLDGRNFVLDDGHGVHLAGIEVPVLAAGQEMQSAGTETAQAALAGLTALVNAADIELRQGELALDRYDRMVAYAEVSRDGTPRSVQAELIAAGVARVGGDIQSQVCALDLLRRERAARAAKLGLWADPYYRPLPADDAPDILEQRGHFALIEGKVFSVHQSGATVYVNFGRHWSEDFAVAVPKRNAGKFAAAGVDLNGLAGLSVMVRGWIQARANDSRGSTERALWRAPWIEAEYPEQIEPAGHD